MSFPLLRNLFASSRPSREGRGRKKQPSGRWNTLALEVLEDRCLLAVLTVTTTDDAGPGSLRQAILDAKGSDTIAFNIGDGGVQTIRPQSALPQISRPIIIDGTTQPGFAGQPLIVLSGTNPSGNSLGLWITANGCTVRGLVIQNFGTGIFVYFASNEVITGNYFGTDVSGTQAQGNGAGLAFFVSGNNRIGGTEPGTGNLISGNAVGIALTGESGPAPEESPATASNFIQGNYIGTDVTGTQAVPNGTGISIVAGTRSGVPTTLIGGVEAGAGNLISGNNGSGIVIQNSGGHMVQGNYIGTDITGTRALGNHAYGVEISQGSNLIGGTTLAARNLISSNGIAGVHIVSNGNLITNLMQGNWIGTDITGSASLGNGTGIRIDGAGQTVGGTEVGAGNLISGNFTAGVLLAGSSNHVQGNLIGTDAAGIGRVSNGYGVYIVGGSDNLIGGMQSAAGNVISGNAAGVVIFSSQGNAVQGNRVGTDASGMLPLGNGDGIEINGPDNLVGGTVAGAGNLLSGNLQSGVNISSTGNRVQGNTIGTDITGAGALANFDGIYVGLGANNNLIGGADGKAGNLISGNSDAGVVLAGPSNVVQGNSIGTDVSGTKALGNQVGVRIDGASDNTIGGTSAAARNLISGHQPSYSFDGGGILISDGSGNVVEGNYIGTDISGTQALPNRNGIRIVGGQDNRIGGLEAGAGNLISGNASAFSNVTDGDGILVSQSSADLIQGNYIGTDASGSQALGNRQGINLDGSSDNTIGGTAPGAGNVISANSRFEGVVIAGSNNRVQGNYIGTDATGTQALGNEFGVVIGSSTTSFPGVNNLIGGTEPGAGNLISGNGYGIFINNQSVNNNRVQGNYIGTDVTGSRALGNGSGCFLFTANNTLIGGTVPGAGNLISGNSDSGITVAGNCIVQGNYIGTDATGTLAVPNSKGMVLIGSTNLVGGTEPGARNLISGNTVAGVDIGDMSSYGGDGQQVQGNYIGTDVSGTQALPNGTGVRILAGRFGVSSANTIGGTAAGAGNLISGNSSDGVFIGFSRGNAVLAWIPTGRLRPNKGRGPTCILS